MQRFRAEGARAGLQALATAGVGLEDYLDEAMALIRRAVPADGVCMSTLDPDTVLLSVAHRHDLGDAPDREFFFHEYLTEDVGHFRELARRESSVSILHEETGGDPARSGRYREFLRGRVGAEHELRAVGRRSGVAWAVVAMYRTSASPAFNQAEADFMQRLEGILADGVRAALVVSGTSSAAMSSTDAYGPALLIFDAAGELEQMTDAAQDRLSQIALSSSVERFPAPVSAIMARLRAGIDPAPALRAQTRDGTLLVLRGSRLREASDPLRVRYVVSVEEAGPGETVPFLMSAYGLTPRETRIAQAMLRGDSTQEIAQSLHLSPYTVQDHFKSIFLKLDVSSRREAAARLFARMYAPVLP